MDVHYPTHSKFFRSWDEPGESTSLLVTLTGTSWQLLHNDNRYLEEQTTCLSLSIVEAQSVGSRIEQVLSKNRIENPQDLPRLVVMGDCAGEPYREGIRLSLDTGDWEKDFCLTLTREDATDLAKLLVIKPS